MGLELLPPPPPFGRPLQLVEPIRRYFVPQIQIIFPAGLALERCWRFADGTVSRWDPTTGMVVAVPPAARACQWRPMTAADQEEDARTLLHRVAAAAPALKIVR